MSKKIFTLALLAVFVLAQFSMASASPIAVANVIDGTATLTGPSFNKAGPFDLEWSATGMPASANQYMTIWYRNPPLTNWICYDWKDVSGLASANGTYSSSFVGEPDQKVFEFLVTLSNAPCGPIPSSSVAPMTSIFIDSNSPGGIALNKPSMLWSDSASCNTFEVYALFTDTNTLSPGDGYSGFDSWNETITGTFAPPAPEGPESAELSWIFTFPSTASGNWAFGITPQDKVGNIYPLINFYNKGVTPGELEDCADFTDVAGHADETYIRYLADLDLIAGNPDGSYAPDNTLTRAEAAALFEKANGRAEDDVNFPTSAPAGCEFTDVAASDWFSGWVWAACEDGFMNGVGGGLFDPSNLLTRGQIVTIFNNIHNMFGGYGGGFLDFTVVPTNLSNNYGNFTPELRSAAWTDVFIGAYYAEGVIHSYGVGIADGTSATTFSPDQAITRGEFAKWLYRAIMRV